MGQTLDGNGRRRERITLSSGTPGLVVSNDLVDDRFRAFSWRDGGTTTIALAALRGITELRCGAAEAIQAAADVQRTGLAWWIGVLAAFWLCIALTGAVGAAEGVSKTTGSNVTAKEGAA